MFIQNFVQNEVVELKEQIAVNEGQIISKSLVQREDMTLTLFAFGAGESISTHSSTGDAMVVVLEGEGELTVGGVAKKAKEGQSIIMPANIPHAVQAVTDFKMLLIVIKPQE